MSVKTAIQNRRSIRRYAQTPVPAETMLELVELGRLYASAGNAQPVGFAVVCQKEHTDSVFESLNWAMYLKEFTIAPDQRPPAYILLLSRSGKEAAFDAGGAAATIMLAAKEQGLDTCCLGIARPEPLRTGLGLEEPWHPVYAIAVGYGAQTSKIVPMKDSVRYWMDEKENLVVPKKELCEVLVYADVSL